MTVESTNESSWMFTEPWVPVSVRRGDALGLLPVANEFAQWLAPGLTNRTIDARWLTLLSWCLQRSHMVWLKVQGGRPETPADQRRRYAWLRPLELLWIARTQALMGAREIRYQRPGIQSVSAWSADGDSSQRFRMSPERFSGYRQTGIYGAYRVTFRRAFGLSDGDGWTPGPVATRLAHLVDDSLGKLARPAVGINDQPAIKKSAWEGRESAYWLATGWSEWRTHSPRGFFPSALAGVPKRLPTEERALIAQALFGKDLGGLRRRLVSRAMESDRSKTHQTLCERLARILGKSHGLIQHLPYFSALADSAMNAMFAIDSALEAADDTKGTLMADLVNDPGVAQTLAALQSPARAWTKRDGVQLKHGSRPDALADLLSPQRSSSDRLLDLVRYHLGNGGGVHWFHLSGNGSKRRLHSLPGQRGTGSMYRFGLRSLARMAAQSGVASCPQLFVESDQAADAEGAS
jgi:hypothetical protein